MDSYYVFLAWFIAFALTLDGLRAFFITRQEKYPRLARLALEFHSSLIGASLTMKNEINKLGQVIGNACREM
jgi:hypothetical protein